MSDRADTLFKYTTTRLTLAACRSALRRSLLRHPAVYAGEPFTLVLAVPEDLRKDFNRAALALIKEDDALADVGLGTNSVSLRGRVDYTDVKVSLRACERLVILLDRLEGLPAFLIAAADTIEQMHPIDVEVLVEAVRAVHDLELGHEAAEAMLNYPVADVLAALRPGRDHADVLRRLKAAHDSTLDTKVPPVESLAGFGDAGEWARVVVSELAAWKSGSLTWEDVDSASLLSGPPGVGKTLFARSLARSAGCAFIASSLAQWQAAGHLGDLLKAMRECFQLAAARAPTVLLLDEFDSIGDRTKFAGSNAQYSIEVVAGLLECLDGAYRREGVVVIGACNDPSRIDRALLRPGRLSRHFALSLPDTIARTGILTTHLDGALRQKEIVKIAEATLGLSGAELAQLVADGRRKARGRAQKLRVEDVMSCLPPIAPIKGRLRDRICIHEAGHAAAIIALNVGRLTGVAVMDGFYKGGIGGGAAFDREERLQTAKHYRNELIVQLAGMAAEIVFFEEHLEGSGGRHGSDLQRAADLATSMIAQLGMGGITNFLSAESLEDLDRIRRTVPSVNRRVERLLATVLDEAKELIGRNSEFVCELAAILNMEGSVDGKLATSMFDKMEKPDAAE
ncbi:DNA polymerase III delta prime subunit [Rhizobium aethiopicum]|uniref:DNA polymerase III delta prime subunit n=1 Tax=Rhizobium aethiopicum TaxID=1138170 RepID=A0A7W6MC50_9HYPH|nr:AAA family ATPase [Rhizobium aethiopicum]MBB4190015.1 DNA polymerase III delta prime subunit [Rhizobium aethiopicum]MBB4580246.1 DNA polymerase III delta prime subunit [Rhizobium aethiopicum]